jgi:hypothetical protein
MRLVRAEKSSGEITFTTLPPSSLLLKYYPEWLSSFPLIPFRKSFTSEDYSIGSMLFLSRYLLLRLGMLLIDFRGISAMSSSVMLLLAIEFSFCEPWFLRLGCFGRNLPLSKSAFLSEMRFLSSRPVNLERHSSTVSLLTVDWLLYLISEPHLL